ncbi:hypothetical protein Q8G50_30845, partial [Klebsiella pneumoniae]
MKPAENGTFHLPVTICVTGKGTNDYDAMFSRLAAAKFNGWISIEDGMNGMNEMQASVDFLKAMRAKYYT